MRALYLYIGLTQTCNCVTLSSARCVLQLVSRETPSKPQCVSYLTWTCNSVNLSQSATYGLHHTKKSLTFFSTHSSEPRCMGSVYFLEINAHTFLMYVSICKLQLASSLHSTEQNLDSGLDCGLESGLNSRLSNWTRIN